MKTIFIVMDSLNRHFLNAYGGNLVQTPNIDRLASKSVVFDNHYCGSLPCMPAVSSLIVLTVLRHCVYLQGVHYGIAGT